MTIIPAGATKVVCKTAAAVAYLYNSPSGNPCAMVFFGKKTKAEWSYRFLNEANREKRIAQSFEARAHWEKMRGGGRAERNARTHNFEVGHILSSSWGYDQTNVDFYQVTGIISAKTIELRKIGSTTGTSLGDMSGTRLPDMDNFVGEPKRYRASRAGVKLSSFQFASIWEGRPLYQSSYG